MQTQVVSVCELKEYWAKVDALAVGEWIGVIPLFYMPLWIDICSELSWEFHRVEGGYFSAKSHGFYGVYRLIALEEDDLTKPVTLNRVGGQDTSGTLYIGEAKSLSNRLNQLRRSASSHEGSHGAISMLRQIRLLDFPPNKLGIALLFTGRHTRGVERDLIHAYINSFGDAPLLNYRL
jgi:hypothetical protein